MPMLIEGFTVQVTRNENGEISAGRIGLPCAVFQEGERPRLVVIDTSNNAMFEDELLILLESGSDEIQLVFNKWAMPNEAARRASEVLRQMASTLDALEVAEQRWNLSTLQHEVARQNVAVCYHASYDQFLQSVLSQQAG